MKTKDQRKMVIIPFRVTGDEAVLIKTMASQEMRSVSQWMRIQALKGIQAKIRQDAQNELGDGALSPVGEEG